MDRAVGDTAGIIREAQKTLDFGRPSERVIESHRQYNVSGAVPYHLRQVDDLISFFDGLEVVEAGIVPLGQWRPDIPDNTVVDGCCGVARKP